MYSDFARSVSQNTLERMNRLIRHRGPDEAGYCCRGNVGLAMRRLKIIDLQTGSQPMYNEDGSVAVVFNGEIYNFKDLRRQLLDKGHRFKTVSDTETIVHGYEEWGLDFATRLNGMFAIAVYDGKQKRLVLTRDRFGIKPLYYLYHDRHFVFASEIKCILAAGVSAKQLDHQALAWFLMFEYTPCPHTMVQDIRKCPPGHQVVYDFAGMRLRRYYSLLDNLHRVRNRQHAGEELYHRLKEAVRLRLVSDVPLGAFLSGGVDSSIIVSLMRQCAAKEINTFSIGFAESSYDETAYADTMADYVGSKHHRFRIKPDILDLIDPLLFHLDEPIGDFSIFPTYLVSRVTRDHVTVALSGDGGDELFGGYDTYRAQLLARRYRCLPGPVRSALRRLEACIRPRAKKKGLVNKAKRFIQGVRLPAELRHYRWMTFFSPEELCRLCLNSLCTEWYGRGCGYVNRLFTDAAALDPINQMGYVDLRFYLLENILVKVDRMSMATSLETRVPFLDHHVVEMAFSMPGEWKHNGKQGKVILKQVFAPILPQQIIERGKEGFSIPIKHWIKTALRDMVYDTLSKKRIRDMGLFHGAYVENLLAEHMCGRCNHSHRIWALFIFHKWYDRFLRQDIPGE